MDLSQLSHELLEEAITKGTITVENRVIQLTGTQIISVLKYILDKNIEIKKEEEVNIPTEMFYHPISPVFYNSKGEEVEVPFINPQGE